MKRYKELVSYLIVGGITTFINVITFQLFCIFFNYEISNIFAWIISVIFAFITNKKIVFKTNKNWKKELIFFCILRLFTLAIESFGLYLMISIFEIKPLISKIIINIIVIILNYILSKFFIFHKDCT